MYYHTIFPILLFGIWVENPGFYFRLGHILLCLIKPFQNGCLETPMIAWAM